MEQTDPPEKVASNDGLGPRAPLLERLRPCYPYHRDSLHAEALVEIERLRDALAQSGKLAEDRLQQMKLDRAEFLALRSTISSAPVAIMDTRTALGLCAPTEADFPALHALRGHRVALVDLGHNGRIDRRA